jgi:hypothetical protein
MWAMSDVIENPFIIILALFAVVALVSAWARKVNGPNYIPPMPSEEDRKSLDEFVEETMTDPVNSSYLGNFAHKDDRD